MKDRKERNAPTDRTSIAMILPELCGGFRNYIDRQLRPLGLYVGQEQALFQLLETDGLTQKELAARLHCSPVTVANMVRSLLASEMIERQSDPNDRRMQRIFLTKRSQIKTEKVLALWKSAEDRLTKGLTATQKKQTLLALNQCLNNITE